MTGLFVKRPPHSKQVDKMDKNVHLLIWAARLVLVVIILAMLYFGFYWDTEASEDITRPTVTGWTVDEVIITWYDISYDRACDEDSFGYILIHNITEDKYKAMNAWHVECWIADRTWSARWIADWSYPGGIHEIDYAEIRFVHYPHEVVIPEEFALFPPGIVYAPLVVK